MDSATLVLKVLRSDNKRLKSQVSEMSATEAGMRLQLATAQFSISRVVFEPHRSKRDEYSRLLRFLIGYLDRLAHDFITLVT